MDNIIGRTLDDRYEIQELIGTGGMAEVYKGKDVVEDRIVAVKILKKEYAENDEFLRRFLVESKAIAVLDHPNIVKMYDVSFSGSMRYIVMEYIDGVTLKEYMNSEKKLSWKSAVHFATQILRALQHAHEQGVVHRDIKPQNTMVLSDGTVKVMDFGIAKFSRDDSLGNNDQAIGSVHYISPEQARASVTDERSDIYSLGVMMYEMLTGKKPFDADTPVTIALKHTNEMPERPRAVNPDIPDGLEEIVLKAMEKAPEDRYQTANEMIDDLNRFKKDPSMHFGYYQEETDDIDDSTHLFQTQSEPALQPAYAGVSNGVQQYQNQQQQYRSTQNNDDYDDYDDEDEDDDERPSLVVPVLTAVVVVVIIGAVIFIATLLSGLLKESNQTSDYIMKDFVGMDFNDAVSQYGQDIQFQEDGTEYNALDAGLIFEQDIPPGTEFKKGVVLKVKISKGMETVEVPDLAGMNAEIARDQLRQRGLECEIKNSSSTEVPKGNVIKTDPEANETVHKGMTVILYVSMGIEAGQVSVEDYVGMPVDDAVTLAEYRGLKVKTEDVASYEDENKVVKQSIEKGEKVEAGTEITFYFSNGQNPDGEIDYTIGLPGDANGRFIIDFMIKDEEGKMTSDSTTTILCPEMGSITQTIKGSGEHVEVTAALTNLNTNVRSVVGTYEFNFATGTITALSENIRGAFEAVGGFTPVTEPPTEEPTEEPTEAPTDPPTEAPAPQHQEYVDGEYVNGTWMDYNPGVNGEWNGSSYVWYQEGVNGSWSSGSWVWYRPGENGYWDGGTWDWNNEEGQNW